MYGNIPLGTEMLEILKYYSITEAIYFIGRLHEVKGNKYVELEPVQKLFMYFEYYQLTSSANSIYWYFQYHCFFFNY